MKMKAPLKAMMTVIPSTSLMTPRWKKERETSIDK
jgi:hypothetical protein